MDNLSSNALRIVLNENMLDTQRQTNEQLKSISDIVNGAVDYYTNIRVCVINMLDSKENNKLETFKREHLPAITELYEDVKIHGEFDSCLWNTHTNFLDIVCDMKRVIKSSKCKRCMCNMKKIFHREPYNYHPFSLFEANQIDEDFELDEMDETIELNGEDFESMFNNDTKEEAIKKQYRRYEMKLNEWEKDTKGHISTCQLSKTFVAPPKFEDYYDDECEKWFDEKTR